MNKYIATIGVNGISVKTMILADSPLHALLKIEYRLGIGSVLVKPIKVDGEINSYMLLDEVIKTYKPLTPQQQRIKSLQTQRDNAGELLKAERAKQKIQKAQKQIRTAQQSLI